MTVYTLPDLSKAGDQMSLFKIDHSISKGDAVTGLGGVQLGVGTYDAAPPCRNFGSLAMLAAMRRAWSRSRLQVDLKVYAAARQAI